MFIDRLNLNQLRIFECVYRTGSMTLAANELHLTQSGDSQHIKTLEGSIEEKLFDRLNQKLVPTKAAQVLFDYCNKGLNEIETALWEIKGDSANLHGSIALGMPIEFGNNILLPLLSKFGKENPFVKFDIKLDFASAMNDLLLSGDLDMAFVDDYQMSTPIDTQKVFTETFELCSHPDKIVGFNIENPTKEDFEGLEYIAYQKGEPVLHRWFNTHFPGKRFDLNVRLRVMDVQATSRMILSGFGVGILPGYLLEGLTEKGAPIVRVWEGKNNVENGIHLATLRDRTLSRAASALKEFLVQEL